MSENQSTRPAAVRSVKGTRDLLPRDTALWQKVEDEARRVFAAYHFGEIRTPILEQTSLFSRSVGEDTDIVGKEMYTFTDPSQESLTLRPEATASVVRAYIEHSLHNEGGIHKLYYIGPMFRRDRPQKGRYRQFYQIGAEVLGSEHPGVDVEVFEMLTLFLKRLGLQDFTLLINSVGDKNCRPAYVEVLRRSLAGVRDQMCGDCQRRADTNPLRVLDCKVPADQPIIEGLPKLIDYLCADCRQHFDQVRAGLDQRGITYQLAPRLVRGLDYYTRTTYEITSGVVGAQNSILGGGRYDGLSEMLGGPAAPGTGFAIGEDRLVLTVEAAGRLKPDRSLAVYVAWLGDAAAEPAAKLARELRERGLGVEIGYEPAKLKKSLGTASKLGARFAVIIGEGELATSLYQVKDLDTGQQEAVEPGRLAEYVGLNLNNGQLE
jgi:histidyl-tRNA synthetase